ncbi:unnamed protein product [Urochloa decumbens]|uniref:Uncharacterized protein n=1 Tax=Urochloa decumbens TaxID=240449 RepID=A0ABC8ZND6_9POAL
MMEKRGAARAMENAAPKRPRTVRRAAAVAEKEQQHQDGAEVPRTLTVTLDLDALKCPLCFAPFEASIFQASSFSPALDLTLLSFYLQSARTGTRRARPAAPASAGRARPAASPSATSGAGRWRAPSPPCSSPARSPATAARRGSGSPSGPCTRRSSASARRPRALCRQNAYAGLDLHGHILDAHSASGDAAVISFAGNAPAVVLRRSAPFRVLLHETDRRVFLLLNGGDVPSGRSLSVVCVGPRPGGNKSLEYELQVGGGALALSASGPVPCTRLWAGHHPTEGFLFVPDAYWSSSSGCVSVNVNVRKLTVDRA